MPAALALMAGALLGGCHTKQMVGNDHSAAGTEHVCASCHGMEGKSDNPSFPNLAGQQKAYLETQLKAFRDKTRADPHARTYMFGMAAELDDTTIDGLAGFYASQKPADGVRGDPALMAAGEKIFKAGIDAENVPACAACHGDNARGNGAIPGLAGQHAAYIREQLRAFKTNARANETMHQNASGMTEDQITAVAAYLRSI
jgi:cytochrome c553